MTTEQRMDELEEAVLVFLALMAGEPTDATKEEIQAMQERLAVLAENMRGRLVVGTGTLKGDR